MPPHLARIALVINDYDEAISFYVNKLRFERIEETTRLLAEEVTIIRPPTDFPYGRVLVFADLYGNLWDLIQPSGTAVL